MTHIRGYNYELQIFKYLVKNYTDYDIYEWKNTPFKYIQKYNFIDLTKYKEDKKSFMDVGCDIFMVNKNNDEDVIIVQCKNYENNKVCVDDLAGFFQLIALTPIPIKGLIISNTLLSNQITFRLKHVDIVKFLNIPYEENIKIEENIIITPRAYQLEAVEKFKTINKGILQLFCGMGKTFTSILIAEQFDNIIILSPLRSYASQLLDVFSKKLKNRSYNLISSDGVRNLDEILKNKKDKNIYSATFCSSDVVYELLKHLDNVILIVDEFHNLSFNNINDKNNIMYKILMFEKISKKLFMSATLKIYEPTNKDDEVIEHSTDNYEEIFGKVFYSYNFKMAVQNNFVNDYQIIIPNVENEKNMYEFIYFNMLYHGYKKCLIYCKSILESEKFMEEINKINKNNYNFHIFVKLITYKTLNNARTKIIENFKKDMTKLNFIISVHTLDECVDIPICNSVYITYNVKNSINIIQRISRSLRIYENKQKSGIFLWCEKYNDLFKINKIIRDYDIQFLNKVFIKYNEKSDVVKNKIKKILNEIEEPKNEVVEILDVKNNNVEIMDIDKIMIKYKDYFEKNEVDEFIVKIFFGSKTEFYILDIDVSNYLSISLITLRKRLNNIYSIHKLYFENKDFIKIKVEHTNTKKYMLNNNCFLKLVMSGDSVKSKNINLKLIEMSEYMAKNF
jgi:superfamily II DNA or RNA helicase